MAPLKAAVPNPIDRGVADPACSRCRVRKHCLAAGLGGDDLQAFERIVHAPLLADRGAVIYRPETPLGSVFVINQGMVMTYDLTVDGQKTVNAFNLPGELVGTEAIATGVHSGYCEALEPSTLCAIGFTDLEQLCMKAPAIQRAWNKQLGHIIVENGEMLTALAKMNATQRVARFIGRAYDRLRVRGVLVDCVRLPMSRSDIADYLGLTTETVSRQLHAMESRGLIRLGRHSVQVLGPETVMHLGGYEPPTGGHTITTRPVV